MWALAPPPGNAGREGLWAEPGAAGWRWPAGGQLAGSTIFRCFLYFIPVLPCPVPGALSTASSALLDGVTPKGGNKASRGRRGSELAARDEGEGGGKGKERPEVGGGGRGYR